MLWCTLLPGLQEDLSLQGIHEDLLDHLYPWPLEDQDLPVNQGICWITLIHLSFVSYKTYSHIIYQSSRFWFYKNYYLQNDITQYRKHCKINVTNRSTQLIHNGAVNTKTSFHKKHKPTFAPSFPADPGKPCSPGGPGGPGWPLSPIGPVSPVGPCKQMH